MQFLKSGGRKNVNEGSEPKSGNNANGTSDEWVEVIEMVRFVYKSRIHNLCLGLWKMKF